MGKNSSLKAYGSSLFLSNKESRQILFEPTSGFNCNPLCSQTMWTTMAEYRQAVLTTLRQVEDCLATPKILAHKAEPQEPASNPHRDL